MTRTIFLLLVVFCGGLLIVGKSLAQVLAQPASAAAAAPAAPAPVRPTEPRAVNPPVPVPPVGFPGAGAVIYSGAGGHAVAFPFNGHGEQDAEMSKLTQQEHELERDANQLMRSYASTDDYQEREELRGQIRGLLEKQFDAQRQRRELELKRVEERLARLRDQLRKRNDARTTIIDRRLEQLTSDAEGLGWSAPAGGVGFTFAGPGGPDPFAPPPAGRVPRVAR